MGMRRSMVACLLLACIEPPNRLTTIEMFSAKSPCSKVKTGRVVVLFSVDPKPNIRIELLSPYSYTDNNRLMVGP